MAIMKVKIMNTSHVKPKKPLGKRQCNLTTFDLPYLAFYYNQKLLLYKFENPLDLDDAVFNDNVVDKLKEGLRLVLEDFYQLAGKLAKDDDGVFRVEFDADSDGGEIDGVEFSVAAADDVGVDGLTAQDAAATLKELVPYNGILNVEGLRRPLLAVQVTKLKDGLAMGLAFNHMVLDGTSTWHFLSSWAEICSGAHSISTQPFLDRSKARDTRVSLHLALPNGDDSSAASSPQLREKVFRFSDSAVNTIKSKTNASSSVIPSDGSDPKPFSTFQSLSAHIWRHVTLARGLKPEDLTIFTVFADCRRRVDPPMPEEYFGNLIQAIFTGTAAGLLASAEAGPAIGAATIQKAIAAHDARAIQARNEEWEKSPRIFQWKDAGANCVAVGSSPRFKVYDVDFGWGKPESVRSGSNNRFDGMVYLYQGKTGGRSIDVEISLEASIMEKLENDEDFLLKITEEAEEKKVNGSV